MNIVVLAGGLSTERDVSFKTGSMVAKALKENGHKVILLDVFMGYSDREEDLAAQSKERRWLVRISMSVPAEVALEQWTEQKKRTAMFSK